mmetsp:Transcript_9414/g.15500  ORF Transcript_9414/g.15500 Transcript_9414/m.15500 type:complete len:100 (-) Transcript_9414:2456-2755(-)
MLSWLDCKRKECLTGNASAYAMKKVIAAADCAVAAVAVVVAAVDAAAAVDAGSVGSAVGLSLETREFRWVQTNQGMSPSHDIDDVADEGEGAADLRAHT